MKYHGRKAVHFKVPIDQNTVSAYQAAPGYSSGIAPCNVVVTIVNTLGAAH